LIATNIKHKTKMFYTDCKEYKGEHSNPD